MIVNKKIEEFQKKKNRMIQIRILSRRRNSVLAGLTNPGGGVHRHIRVDKVFFPRGIGPLYPEICRALPGQHLAAQVGAGHAPATMDRDPDRYL